jgi:TPR repeat protein
MSFSVFIPGTPQKSSKYYDLGISHEAEDDFEKAEHYYIQAMEYGSLLAGKRLGSLYIDPHFGSVGPDRIIKATECFLWVGNQYRDKALMPEAREFYAKAISLLNEEISQGNASEAYYKLGLVYEETLRGPKKAIYCYEKAANLNNIQASLALDFLYGKQRDGQVQEPVFGLDSPDTAEGLFQFGETCFNHDNLAGAVKYYKMAADQGHEGAKTKLMALQKG